MKYIYLISLAWLNLSAPTGEAHAAEDGLAFSGSVRTPYETLSGQSRAGFGARGSLQRQSGKEIDGIVCDDGLSWRHERAWGLKDDDAAIQRHRIESLDTTAFKECFLIRRPLAFSG